MNRIDQRRWTLLISVTFQDFDRGSSSFELLFLLIGVSFFSSRVLHP